MVVVVVVDLDGDGNVEVDATVDAHLITSSEAAHSIASPRAIL